MMRTTKKTTSVTGSKLRDLVLVSNRASDLIPARALHHVADGADACVWSPSHGTNLSYAPLCVLRINKKNRTLASHRFDLFRKTILNNK